MIVRNKKKILEEQLRNKNKKSNKKNKRKLAIVPYRKHKHLEIDGSIKAKAAKNTFAMKNRLNIQVNSKQLAEHVEIHSLDLIMKPIYKFYQATLFYMGKERQYNDTLYDGNFYHRFKHMFLNKINNYKYRYALPRSLKKRVFDNPRSNFGLDLHTKAKVISNAVNYISKRVKPTKTDIKYGYNTFYIYAPKNLKYTNKQLIRQLAHGNAEKYKNLNKWGIKGAEYYNKARRKSTMKTLRYNFIYYNMSIFRYIWYKNYVNKLISLLIRKYKDPHTSNNIKLRMLHYIKKFILFLPSTLKKMPTLLSLFKMKLSEKLDYKQQHRKTDEKFKYVLRRWYITNIRDTYFSFIKSMLLRYFKLNLIISFGKSNIFIVFANHSGSVIDYRSIGMLGYKKEKKKTQYASEDLIRETFPDFFDYFKLRFGVLLEIIGYFTSDLFKFYFNTILDPILDNPRLDMVIEDKKHNRTYKGIMDEALSYWNYNSKSNLHHIKLGFAKVMLYTWEKYATLKVVLKGAKQKIKKLMRNILKRLRIYQYENEVFLSKILFIARNVKPHNGCRSPKKGRKKTKRRKQRLKYKHKYKMKQYDFKQKYLSHEFKWRRNLTRTYDLPYPDHLQRDSTLRVLSRGMQHRKNLTQLANFGTNLLNPAYKLSLYSRPNNTKPRLSLFHLGKPKDLSKHFVRQLPDLAKENSKLNKTIKFYRRTIK